mgnify:CR=1 FL=1
MGGVEREGGGLGPVKCPICGAGLHGNPAILICYDCWRELGSPRNLDEVDLNHPLIREAVRKKFPEK